MQIPESDYSNVRFTMADLNRFSKDGNVKVSDDKRKQLNTIFKSSDKFDEYGRHVKQGDGILNIEERVKFLNRVQKEIPDLFNDIVDFALTVELIEDLRLQNEQKSKKQ